MFSYFCGAPICASLATPPSPGMSLRQTRYSSHGGLVLLDIQCSLESSRAALVDVATPAALEWRRRGRVRRQLAVTVAQESLRPVPATDGGVTAGRDTRPVQTEIGRASW